jgi:DNA-binding GntR family transcriptional regulator
LCHNRTVAPDPDNRRVTRLATVSAAQALEHDLERRVLEGELAPGEHLPETELSEEYGVGRHTLRAAFDALVRRGLLVKERNRGVSVRVLTAVDLQEIYELREAIEIEAFRILAGRQIVPPAARQAIADLEGLDADSPRPAVIEADLAFHRAIVAGTENGRLLRVHEELESEIRLCLAQLVRGYADQSELAADHAKLLETVERGRVPAAEEAIREHFEHALAWLVQRLQASSAV